MATLGEIQSSFCGKGWHARDRVGLYWCGKEKWLGVGWETSADRTQAQLLKYDCQLIDILHEECAGSRTFGRGDWYFYCIITVSRMNRRVEMIVVKLAHIIRSKKENVVLINNFKGELPFKYWWRQNSSCLSSKISFFLLLIQQVHKIPFYIV